MFRPHTLYIGIRIVRKVLEPVLAMQDQDVNDVIQTKNRTAMKYIGIDVSKATFVVAYSCEKSGEIRTFTNTTTGIKQFIGTLPKDGSIHCVMEATGNYSALLLYMLNIAGLTVSMENPLKVKNFARAMLSTVKTDQNDARLIALYGEKMTPQPFKERLSCGSDRREPSFASFPSRLRPYPTLEAPSTVCRSRIKARPIP